MRAPAAKILDLGTLAGRLAELRSAGKTIVLCHGCFDLMHPGHVKHLLAARALGDVLVVTVTPDRYVDKGEGRPVFDERLRAETLAALECVDLVAVNEWPTAEETLRLLKPQLYVKGGEFAEGEDATGKLARERAVVDEIGAVMRFTGGDVVFSSTALINAHVRKP